MPTTILSTILQSVLADIFKMGNLWLGIVVTIVAFVLIKHFIADLTGSPAERRNYRREMRRLDRIEERRRDFDRNISSNVTLLPIWSEKERDALSERKRQWDEKRTGSYKSGSFLDGSIKWTADDDKNKGILGD